MAKRQGGNLDGLRLQIEHRICTALIYIDCKFAFCSRLDHEIRDWVDDPEIIRQWRLGG